MAKTAELLRPDGRACFIYTEKRRADFLAAAGENGLSLRRTRSVQPRAGEPVKLFLTELVLAGGPGPGAGDEVMPPLILFAPDGKYTDETEAVFSG
jgi:tRNA1(Val) A37 N6-methylase TrmN6